MINVDEFIYLYNNIFVYLLIEYIYIIKYLFKY